MVGHRLVRLPGWNTRIVIGEEDIDSFLFNVPRPAHTLLFLVEVSSQGYVQYMFDSVFTGNQLVSLNPIISLNSRKYVISIGTDGPYPEIQSVKNVTGSQNCKDGD